MRILRRMAGVVMLLTSIIGLAISAAGTIYGHRLVGSAGEGLEESLDLTVQSLDTTEETLRLLKENVGQVNDGLDTVESVALNVSQAISETRPLLSEITLVVSHQVPDSLEAFQTAVPGMSQSAAVVDRTLMALSNLRVEREVLGFPIQFDLGIDYAPEVPFDESVKRIGESMEGVTPRLRGLEPHLEIANDNLEMISQDIATVSGDLDVINSGIADVAPLLDDSVHIVADLKDFVGRTQMALTDHVSTASLAVTVVMAWIGLAQIVSLCLGWELATGRRERRLPVPNAPIHPQPALKESPEQADTLRLPTLPAVKALGARKFKRRLSTYWGRVSAATVTILGIAALVSLVRRNRG